MKRARRLAAELIVSLATLVSLAELGAAVRGPHARGVGRDIAAGAIVAGVGIAVAWAGLELEQAPAPAADDE